MRTFDDLLGLQEGLSVKEYLSQSTVSKDFKIKIYNILEDPYVPELVTKQLAEIYDSSSENWNLWVRGAIGFYLFACCSEYYALNKRKSSNDALDYKNKASKYLNHPDVVRFLIEEYDLDFIYSDAKYSVSRQSPNNSLRFHESGTTSYIFRLSNYFALKLVKFRFLRNQTITQATENYSRDYQHSSLPRSIKDCVPEVYSGSPKYLIMDFIDGLTLREYMKRYLFKYSPNRKSFDERITITINIITRLCGHLFQLSKSKRQHLDLSPDNVIIVEDYPDMKVFLIDFGFNYLLSERVGSGLELSMAQKYIAPELLESTSQDTSKADVYSLGIILLEMLSDDQLESHMMVTSLDAIWSKRPDFALLIEQMTVRDVGPRTFNFSTPPKLYTELVSELEQIHSIYKEVHLTPKASFWEKLSEGMPFFVGRNLTKIFEASRKLRTLSNNRKIKSNLKYLLPWEILAESLHYVILVCFSLLTLVDLGFIDTSKYFSLIGLHGIDISPGSFSENIWGRLVGISFSFVAVNYYDHVYKLIDLRGLATGTEIVIRITSFSYALPILWAILYKPTDWPYCSAVGVFIVSLANYLAFHTAMHWNDEIEEKFPGIARSNMIQQFLLSFKAWWEQMAIYGVSLALIGILLKTNHAKDEWVYALAVAVMINMVKMYTYNTEREAHIVATNLRRIFENAKLAKKMRLV